MVDPRPGSERSIGNLEEDRQAGRCPQQYSAAYQEFCSISHGR